MRARLVVVLVGSTMAAIGAVSWLRRVEVRGASMSPSFEDGDRLLVRPVGHLRVGDVVVLGEPGTKDCLVVKRVAAIQRTTVVVLGDNEEASRDSRAYGPVARRAILGRVWWCYHPADRAGRQGRWAGPDGRPRRPLPTGPA